MTIVYFYKGVIFSVMFCDVCANWDELQEKQEPRNSKLNRFQPKINQRNIPNFLIITLENPKFPSKFTYTLFTIRYALKESRRLFVDSRNHQEIPLGLDLSAEIIPVNVLERINLDAQVT